MPIVPSYSADYLVRGFDCGYGGPLRTLPLLDFFQETANLHADVLDIGMSRMQATGSTWMISRIDARIDALPRAGDRVSVETWPAGRERLFALRDFVMRAADGRSLVRAVYAYLIVDIAARRPLRPERFFGEAEPKGAAPHPVTDLSFSVPALPLPADFALDDVKGDARGGDLAFAQRACPRHIDNNGHVNNAHIVNWLVDAVPPSERGGGNLASLRVAFVEEILVGDIVEARWGLNKEGGTVGVLSELCRGKDVTARAITAWE